MMWQFRSNPTKMKYKAKEAGSYYSPRYDKTISWTKGYESDGATGPLIQDLDYRSFFAHDRACQRGTWDDGTPITNWQASHIYCDSLYDSANAMKGRFSFIKRNFRKARAQARKIGTFFLGGKNLKKF